MGFRLHVRPVEGRTVQERLTVPVNPLAGVIVIVDGPIAFASTVTSLGLAANANSVLCAVIVTVAL